MILRKRAEEILGLVERAEAEVKANEELLTGDIYLGCGESEGMLSDCQDNCNDVGKIPSCKISFA